MDDLGLWFVSFNLQIYIPFVISFHLIPNMNVYCLYHKLDTLQFQSLGGGRCLMSFLAGPTRHGISILHHIMYRNFLFNIIS